MNTLRLARINAHVVEFHALWPYVGIDALGGGPVSSRGNSQNEMEGMIEGPVPLIRRGILQPFVFECVVVGIVHINLDGGFGPFHRVKGNSELASGIWSLVTR